MDDFFEGIDYVDAKFNGGTGTMPVFWRKARAFGGIFPASILKLRKVLPDPRFVPAQVFPGVGAVAIAAYEYTDSTIGAYNEFSVGIVLNSPYHAPIPGYNVLRAYLEGYLCAYIYRLPVSTEIALRAGKDYYGFPKIVADIVFTDTDDTVACELSENGVRIATIEGKKLPAKGMGELTLMGHLYQYRQPQFAEIKANLVKGAIAPGPGNFSYDISESHEMGREIKDLLLVPYPLGYLYVPELQAVLYGPERCPLPLLKHILATADVIPVSSTIKKAAAR